MRIESVGGYEQSLMPARTADLVEALGVGSGLPRRWIQGFARHPDLVARMGVRCAVARNPHPLLLEAGFKRVRGTSHPALLYRNDNTLPSNPISGTHDVCVVPQMPKEPIGNQAWIYNWSTGEIHANVTGSVEDGTRYFDL